MHNKIISSITIAALLGTAIAQPIVYAAENGNMLDKSQQEAEAAQQQQDPQYQQMQQQQEKQIQQVQQQQQNFQQYLSPSGTVTQSRQTIYDTATGQLITLVQNSLGQIFAYTQSGQQVAVQQAWLNNVSFPQTAYAPVDINGNTSGTGTIDTTQANMSQTKAAQLSAVLSAIKTDDNLNAVGKIAKALLALEAIKENNQIVHQQYLAQQKAKMQAQAEQQKKVQQAAQQKDVTQQKQFSPSTKKGEQVEYASVLRDTDAETGGTAQVNIDYSPNADTQQNAELPLRLDLIGKVASVNGDTLTLQDTTGRQIDVDASDSNLQQGDYINVNGTALSGADGNIYIVKDQEVGMDIELNTIDQDTYNQKAAEQEQAAQDFAAEYPYASSISVDPATQEAELTDADYAAQYAEYKDLTPSFLDNLSWTKTAGLAAVAGGAFMMGTAVAASVASGGTALPLTAPLFQVGASLASGGAGALIVQEFYQEAEQTVQERHPGTSQNNNIREKANALEEEVNSHMQ